MTTWSLYVRFERALARSLPVHGATALAPPSCSEGTHL